MVGGLDDSWQKNMDFWQEYQDGIDSYLANTHEGICGNMHNGGIRCHYCIRRVIT